MFSAKQRWILVGATSISLLIVVATLLYVKIDSGKFNEDLKSLAPVTAEPVTPMAAIPTEPDILEMQAAMPSEAEADEDVTFSSVDDSEDELQEETLQSTVSEVQRQIAQIRENPEIDATEPQTRQTLRDVWQEAGLSDEDLEQVMAVVPFNPNTSLDQFEDVLATMHSMTSGIDAMLKEATDTLTLEEARALVDMFKTEVPVNEEEYRYITRELFPSDIRQALIAEGVL